MDDEKKKQDVSNENDFDPGEYWNKLEKGEEEEEEEEEEEKEEEEEEEGEEEEEEKEEGEEEEEKEEEEEEEEKKEEEKEEEEEKKKELEGKSKDKSESDKLFDETKVEEYIEEYSVKENISKEQAREVITKDLETAKNYGYDPVKMARSIRSSQSEYSKLQNKVKQLESKDKEDVNIQITEEGLKTKTAFYEKDKLIDMYRRDYPRLSDDLEDEKVWELVKQHTLNYIREEESKRVREAQFIADDKIKGIIEKLPDNDKEFANDLREILKFADPLMIIKDNFDHIHYLNTIKGAKFDDRIKAARAEAYERGRESVKIREKRIPSGSNRGHAPLKKGTISLSPSQKREALNMFDGLEENEAFKAYKEIIEEKKRIENKNKK